MAWTDVECNECGKTYSVQMYGKIKDREWKAANWWGSCDDCKEKSSQDELEKAIETAKEMGLPPLQGTEKQVAWAERIRASLVEKFSVRKETDSTCEEKTSASWWIDMRNEVDFERFLAAKVRTPEKQAIRKEVDIEATVYPENPATPLITTIQIKDKTISAILPEKNEDFRQVVRFQLGYSWTGNSWERYIGKLAGRIEDRAAEIGHALLLKGFPIRIYSDEIRTMATLGQYEPEQTKWIINTDNGIGIQWGKNEDYYKDSKMLRGSRYNRDLRAVEVPAENFEEVLDFAEVNGFSISEKATEKINSAKRARDGALKIKVVPIEKPKVEKEELSTILEIPDELRDDD